MSTRGRFITVEGIEGVGKSSNIGVLVNTLQAAGKQVVTTREPGGTPMAEGIRELLVSPRDEHIPEIAELLMMFSARSLNVENVIKPALAAGSWVVSDRFTDSSRAYQGGGRGMPMATIDALADWVHGDTVPDLTLLLDAPAATGLERVGQRGAPDRFEQEKLAFFERVRTCYLQLAEQDAERITVIDTTHSLADVQAEVRSIAATLVRNDR